MWREDRERPTLRKMLELHIGRTDMDLRSPGASKPQFLLWESKGWKLLGVAGGGV